MLVVANLAVEHPAWSPPPELLAKLRDEFPHIELHWNQERRSYFRRAAEAEIIWGWQLMPEVFVLASQLKWFHSCASGVAGSIFPELQRSRVVLTNSASVNAPVVVEHLLGMILALTRRLPKLNEYQRSRHWGQTECWDHWRELKPLGAMTVGLFGHGAIGSQLCTVFRALGSRVLVYRRQQSPAAECDGVFTGREFAEMLPQCDLVLDVLPGTDETSGFFDAEKFSLMKDGAIFGNVGRGRTVDESALTRALGFNKQANRWESTGWLAGAVLDVFDREPLPAESPLWAAPNVVLSPHVASVSPDFWIRQTELFARNLRHFLAGEPLEEVVDLQAGY